VTVRILVSSGASFFANIGGVGEEDPGHRADALAIGTVYDMLAEGAVIYGKWSSEPSSRPEVGERFSPAHVISIGVMA
jgi:hypothetical protein